MRTLQLLGLAALAILVLALCGGTASATVLCKINTTPCISPVSAGTKVEMSLSGVSTMKALGTDECSGSPLVWKVENAGGSTSTVSGKVENLEFTGCSCTTKVLKAGEAEVHWVSGTMNGTLTSKNAEVTTNCSGIDCVYGTGSGTSIGTLTGGEVAKLDVSATLAKISGVFCTSTATWTATYQVNGPKPLYVAEWVSGEGPTSTSLTTSLSGEEKSGEEITVNESSKVKDTATLSGTNASKATGTVKYKVYADKECKEFLTSAGEVTVTSGSVPASEEKTLEAGRVYYWQAEYSGDSNNLASTSTCGKEVLTVQATTSLSTSLSGEEKSGEEIAINEGSKVKDTATLSGTKSSTATGKVKFTVYKDKECKELATEAGEGSLSEAKATSEEKTLEAGAVYYWQAEYPGDSLHQSSTGTCGKEVLTVKAATSLSGTLSAEEEEELIEGEEITVYLGIPAKDKGTLGGTNHATATGTVTYKIYADNECKELVAEAGEASVEGGEVPVSEEIELEEGTYYWQVKYSGDTLHEASESVCGGEVLQAVPAGFWAVVSPAVAIGRWIDNQTFEFKGHRVECAKAWYLSQKFTGGFALFLTVEPTYKECSGLLGGGATEEVKSEGCEWTLTARVWFAKLKQFQDKAFLTCPAGNEMKILAYNPGIQCEVTVAPQEVNYVASENIQNPNDGKRNAVRVVPEIGNLTYKVRVAEKGCKLPPVGSYGGGLVTGRFYLEVDTSFLQVK
jgi:hypothetical protein